MKSELNELNAKVSGEPNGGRCEKAMERYLSLDKNEVLPPSLTIHLLRCKKCRTEVHYLSLAEKVAAKGLKVPLKIPGAESRKQVSLAKWVVCGAAMIFLLIAFGISGRAFNQKLQVAFYICFALSVCLYCSVFISTNLDYFVKKIEKMGGGRLGAGRL